jgi:2-C-methyl-D-erythritol 4-phosphate cytidylyltransferase
VFGDAPAIALVLAGGLGTRMGRTKQFLEIGGKPALYHTLKAFEDAAHVGGIYAVGDGPRVEALARGTGISKYVRCGKAGDFRQLSTKSGLLLCDEHPDTVVLVHDGSRPLVTPALIERVVEAALAEDRPDGVVPAMRVSDTVKVEKGGEVVETLDRTQLRAVRLGYLRQLHDATDEYLGAATDDASLVEREGGRVVLVEGEKTNIKLTTPEDLIFAEAILAARGRGPLRSFVRERR